MAEATTPSATVAAASGDKASRTIPIRASRDRPTTPRLMREQRTLEAMTAIWCRDQHGPQPDGAALCPACSELMAYAAKRLAVCPYGEEKPVCAKCQIHCYGPAPREEVRVIMRYAGPKMMLRHPILALGHVLDKRYVAPPKPRARARTVAPQAANAATVGAPAAGSEAPAADAATTAPAPSVR